MAHQIVWCDIPVTDLDRAIRFYSAILGNHAPSRLFASYASGEAEGPWLFIEVAICYNLKGYKFEREERS